VVGGGWGVGRIFAGGEGGRLVGGGALPAGDAGGRLDQTLADVDADGVGAS
jgi:hypothetical protein